ncbi:hypothetical protein [Bacillus sp. P14.5]|uniref:hypothetical protein n=1 Tax=Bacillus sp. P14.5 TaxID=1983400 RepID=UPI000DE94B7A|nr:hypothetical protein [Bacillus sp. P14.5]
MEEQEKETYPAPEAPGSVEYDLGSVSWHSVPADDIIGYRVYKKDAEGKEFNHIASISSHERKNFYDDKAEKGSAYYITSVNIAGKESEKSRIVQDE